VRAERPVAERGPQALAAHEQPCGLADHGLGARADRTDLGRQPVEVSGHGGVDVRTKVLGVEQGCGVQGTGTGG
jgi:hypothetical protein